MSRYPRDDGSGQPINGPRNDPGLTGAEPGAPPPGGAASSNRKSSGSFRLSYLLVLAAVAAIGILFLSSGGGEAATLVVGSGGHSSINAAVQAANPGDTVLVHAGTYREEVQVDRSVTIMPFGDGLVWVDAECVRTNNFFVTADNVAVKQIGAKKAIGAAIDVRSADNLTLDGITVQDFNCTDANDKTRAGVAVRNSSGLKIVNSTIARRVEVAGSPGGRGNAIWVKNSKPSTGGGHYIADNTITGGWDCIGGEPENDSYGTFYKDTVIERNTLSNCWDDAIQVEGGTANVYVRDNYIQRSAIGIAFAPSTTGPLYIERNTIVDGQPGYYGATFAFKMGDGGGGTVYLTDNYVDTPGDGFKQTNAGLGPVIISRGNVLKVTRYVIEFKDAPAPGSSLDGDCFWTTDSSRFAKWAGAKYGSLASFQAATGQELNGTVSETCSAGTPLPPPPPQPTPSPAPTTGPTPPPAPQSTATPSPTTVPAPQMTPIIIDADVRCEINPDTMEKTCTIINVR